MTGALGSATLIGMHNIPAFIAIGSEAPDIDGGVITFLIAGVFLLCAALLLGGYR